MNICWRTERNSNTENEADKTGAHLKVNANEIGYVSVLKQQLKTRLL